MVVNLEPKNAASGSAADRAAAERSDAYMNRQYLDPLFFGHFPEEVQRLFGAAWPRGHEDDVALFREPIDFLGVNYYKTGTMRHDTGAGLVQAGEVIEPGAPRTEIGWSIDPAGLPRALRWVRERYGPIPLYVTENGAAFADPAHPTAGSVDDPPRIAYLRDHLIALHDALASGVDVRGYFVWSLLDNCEWTHGTSKRFGIVHVDYTDQRRTPKGSARFYQDVIRSRGRILAPR
jgi:beta-glucosidase